MSFPFFEFDGNAAVRFHAELPEVVQVKLGDRLYDLIRLNNARMCSAEVLIKAREMGAEASQDDVNWFVRNSEELKEALHNAGVERLYMVYPTEFYFMGVLGMYTPTLPGCRQGFFRSVPETGGLEFCLDWIYYGGKYTASFPRFVRRMK